MEHKLNALHIPSPMGDHGDSTNVANIAVGLELREKPVKVPREVLQRRVLSIWKKQPDCTVAQVVAMMRPTFPIGTTRAESYLRSCREVAARRSSVQRQTGWRVDGHTAARIRIGDLCKRHPNSVLHR